MLFVRDLVILDSEFSDKTETVVKKAPVTMDPAFWENATPEEIMVKRIQAMANPKKIKQSTKVSRDLKGTRTYARWCSADDQYLIDHWDDSIDSMQRVLGRTAASIHTHRCVLKKAGKVKL